MGEKWPRNFAESGDFHVTQKIFLKNNIKIYIKTAPTPLGAVTPSTGSSLFVLSIVTLCFNSQLWYIGL
jgi:hypothetical protein